MRGATLPRLAKKVATVRVVFVVAICDAYRARFSALGPVRDLQNKTLFCNVENARGLAIRVFFFEMRTGTRKLAEKRKPHNNTRFFGEKMGRKNGVFCMWKFRVVLPLFAPLFLRVF